MECVTIMAVSLLSVMIWLVNSSTKAAVLGSSAAVCSSKSKILLGCKLAMSRLTAWRCPPDNNPIWSLKRFSNPSFKTDSFSRKNARLLAFNALFKRRGCPRLNANAIFSSILKLAHVPAMGSWNTRATKPAR